MTPVGRDAFNRRQFLALGRRDRRDAGPDRRALQVKGAGAALGDTAAELGAGEAEHVAHDPEYRHPRRHVDGLHSSVESEGDLCHGKLPCWMESAQSERLGRIRQPRD